MIFERKFKGKKIFIYKIKKFLIKIFYIIYMIKLIRYLVRYYPKKNLKFMINSEKYINKCTIPSNRHSANKKT